MMTDITVVNFFLHHPPNGGAYACIPMGTLYLCSAAEQAGYSVDFLDYQHQTAENPYSPQAVCNFLEQARSDVIGIGCMTNMLPFLLCGLRLFKKKRPQSYVILGGSGPSGVAPEILTSFGAEVDAVVAGEGEQAIIEILEARRGKKTWDSILGLIYKPNGAVQKNPTRPRRFDVDTIPYPAYHHLDLSKYLNFPVLTARGCPYRCTFCDIAPNWDRLVGQRSIDSVLEEIETLQSKFSASFISILDDVFVLNRKRVTAFCQRVIETGMNFHWSCMCRADLLDDKLIELMYASGCRKIFLGIESGSSRVRNLAGKGLKIDNVEEVIAKTSRHFEVTASFIMGFPFESIEEFHETLLLQMYCIDQGAKPQMSILSPLPQAELTSDETFKKEFHPELVSGMVFPRYQERARRLLLNVLTPEIQELIRSHPKIFSAFYYFTEGRVGEKLELAMQYGMRI
jgi:radical SAM superfamily enzyme YgiQ (UPF0313 family)